MFNKSTFNFVRNTILTITIVFSLIFNMFVSLNQVSANTNSGTLMITWYLGNLGSVVRTQRKGKTTVLNDTQRKNLDITYGDQVEIINDSSLNGIYTVTECECGTESTSIADAVSNMTSDFVNQGVRVTVNDVSSTEIQTPKVTTTEPIETQLQITTETTKVTTQLTQQSTTDVSEADVEMLAKLCAREAGHLTDDEHRFVIWTVFNRVDAEIWVGITVKAVIQAPQQYAGDLTSNNWIRGTEDYRNHLRQLVREEYTKWLNGECCPECTYTRNANAKHGYTSFTGDGEHNWFTK